MQLVTARADEVNGYASGCWISNFWVASAYRFGGSEEKNVLNENLYNKSESLTKVDFDENELKKPNNIKSEHIQRSSKKSIFFA